MHLCAPLSGAELSTAPRPRKAARRHTFLGAAPKQVGIVFDSRDHVEQAIGIGRGEAGIDDPPYHRDHRLPVAVDIDQHDRLFEEVQLAQGDRFEGLVECAQPAWQDRDSIRPREHLALALLHVGHKDKLGQTDMADLAAVERGRDDADDLSTRGERSVGDNPHQADATAAIDQVDPGQADLMAEPRRGLAIGRFRRHRRATEDAEAFTLGHRSVHRQGCRKAAQPGLV